MAEEFSEIIKFQKELVKSQIKQRSTFLSKSFLKILEDLIAEGYQIPPDKYDRLRKRILDNNGEVIRELQLLIDQIQLG